MLGGQERGLSCNGASSGGRVVPEQELVLDVFALCAPLIHRLEAAQLVQRCRHVVVFVSHCRREELLVVQVVEHSDLYERPVAGVGVQLVQTFPQLKLFIHDPNAMVFLIGLDGVSEVNDRLVLLQVQL